MNPSNDPHPALLPAASLPLMDVDGAEFGELGSSDQCLRRESAP